MMLPYLVSVTLTLTLLITPPLLRKLEHLYALIEISLSVEQICNAGKGIGFLAVARTKVTLDVGLCKKDRMKEKRDIPIILSLHHHYHSITVSLPFYHSITNILSLYHYHSITLSLTFYHSITNILSLYHYSFYHSITIILSLYH